MEDRRLPRRAAQELGPPPFAPPAALDLLALAPDGDEDTREHLLQATRIHEDVFDRSTDVQILRLRRKLEADPSAPRIIETERGVGYVFALPVAPA